MRGSPARRSNRVARLRESCSSVWQPWANPANHRLNQPQRCNRPGQYQLLRPPQRQKSRCREGYGFATTQDPNVRPTTPGDTYSSTITSHSTFGGESRVRRRLQEDRSRPHEVPQPRDTASTSRSTAPPSVRPIKVTGVIFGRLRPLAVDPVRDPPGGHCFNCWQHGHSCPACPRPPRRGHCINCGL